MSETRNTLERELERLHPSRIPLDQLAQRRERKHRNQRIRAAVLGVAVAIALGWWGVYATHWLSSVPADDPSLRLVRGWIAYDGGNHDDKIYAVDPTNPEAPRVVLNEDGGAPLAWSSDGTELLIRGNGGGLFVQNPDGTPTYLVGGPDGPSPSIRIGSFSPDGSQVIYLRDFGGDRGTGIYVHDVDGDSRPQLLYRFPNPVIVVGSSLGVAPDGARIAYFEQQNDDKVWDWSGISLWVMDADGTERHQIVRSEDLVEADPGRLEWSPDGTRLTFEMGGSIYVVGADGSGLAVVANDATTGDAYWSPDGTGIAFTTGGPNDRRIAIVRADGTERWELPDTGRAGPWNPLDPSPAPTSVTQEPT